MENLTREEEKKIMDQLSAPLPSEAIQRTKDRLTHKGYDTDGYGYQFCVNRFNEVLGKDWGYEWDVVNVKEGTTKNGAPNYEFTIRLGIWIINKETIRYSAGGHISRTYFDANKGAFSNAFKKAAAMWGTGRHAYEGALDDDNDPYAEPNKTQGTSQVRGEATIPEVKNQAAVASVKGNDTSIPSNVTGLVRRIKAKMEMVCERSEERMSAWVRDQAGVDMGGMDTLTAEKLQAMLQVADIAFENWKAGK